MSYLVLGGTGTVGGAVTQRLVKTGEPVKVLTRNAAKASQLPQGASPVVGDLTDPRTYKQVFDGTEKLFLLIANSISEVHEGLAAVNEAVRVGVKRLVYVSVQDVEKGPMIPHFAGKGVIEEAIKLSGIPYTILRPNNFYQNEFWFKDAIMQFGIYPQPLGNKGVSRVDVQDIADATLNAFTKPEHVNKTYTLAGPEAWTGTDTTKELSRVLGREVRYMGDDLDAWEQMFLQWLPAWMVWDFKIMYDMFQKEGLIATPAQLKETETVVGHAPRKYSDFVQELARLWQQQVPAR